jgi:ACS family glucarate transporter-like MFS transporter
MKTRYVVLLMLVLLSVVTYLDRICIGVAASEIQKDFGITEQAWGWVLGAFLLGYGIFEIPSGGLGDWIGQRKVLTRIVVWWSAFTALTPLAPNYSFLVATRFLFGAGEAGAYPNASGCISRWFPFGERAQAQGLVWGASRLGGALTPLLVVPLMKAFGWQACFWIFGALGLVWAAVWYAWFRDDPASHSAVSSEELAEIRETPVATVPTIPPQSALPIDLADRPTADAANPYASPAHAYEATEAPSHSGIPWGPLFASPQLWLIMSMYFFYVFGFIFFMFWLPKFLTQGRDFTTNEMGICVGLMFTAGALGNFVGGWASDRLSRRYGLAIGRKLIGVTCLTISGLLLLAAAFTPGKVAVSALLILSFGVADGMLPCSWAICLDVGRRYSGAVSGAMNTAGQAAGYICTVLLGYLVTWFGYDTPLLFLAPNLLVAAVLFALIDPTRPLVPEDSPFAIQ